MALPDLSRYPVIINSLVAIAASAATPVLAKYGIDKAGVGELFSEIGALATAVLAAWAVSRAHSQVTPLVDPRNDAGQALTPDVPTTVNAPPVH